MDCGKVNPNMFSIKNDIWLSVAEPDIILCFNCFEKRLGRPVTLYDLHPCQFSNIMLLGAFLYKRNHGNHKLTDFDNDFLEKI